MHDIIPPMPGQNRQSDDSLKLVTYCPVCHHRYNPFEAKVVDENAGAHLLHVKCRQCQSAILALVLTNAFGISSVGLITDLDSQEIEKFRETTVVNSDDVLNLYQYLHSGGGIEELLQ